MLHERGKLLTNYSQNIDNLEVKAGLPKRKLIQCHGSFGTASCVECGYQTDGEAIFPDLKAGNIPRCPRCVEALLSAAAGRRRKRKRCAGAGASSTSSSRRRQSRRAPGGGDSSDNDSDFDVPQAGVMKPDITFFGEPLPDEFSKRLTTNDRDKVDLVIVIGTSLKVTPVSEIVSWLPPQIPQIYISRQAVSHINFDIDLLGDCDVVIAELCRRLGWPMRHEMAVPDAQPICVTTEPGFRSRHVFEVKQPAFAAATSVAINGTAKGTAGGTTKDTAKVVANDAASDTTNGTANDTANGAARGATKGTAKGTAKGAAKGAAKGTTKGAGKQSASTKRASKKSV